METQDNGELMGGRIVNYFGGATIHNMVLNYGTNTMNNYNSMTDTGGVRYTDAEVARALEAIVGKERPIDAKWKWAGAYWWLRWACGWPVDVPRFCRRVQELPFSEALDVKCEYNDIRRVCTLTFMEQDPQKMHAVQPSSADAAQFAACREVALRLAEELRKKTAQPPTGR